MLFYGIVSVNPTRTGASRPADGSIILPSAISISTADRVGGGSCGVKRPRKEPLSETSRGLCKRLSRFWKARDAAQFMPNDNASLFRGRGKVKRKASPALLASRRDRASQDWYYVFIISPQIPYIPRPQHIW